MKVKSQVPRTLIVSDGVPPFVGGSPTIMYTLFQGIDTSNCTLVTQSSEGFSMAKGTGLDHSCKWEIERVETSGLADFYQRGSRFGFPSLAVLLQVPSIVRAAKKKAIEMDAEVILTSWPSNAFAIAGWLAAKRLKIPFVFYLHDLWYETQRTLVQRLIAKFFEGRILRSASKTMVITEAAGEYIKEKYGIDYTTLEHTVDTNIWPLEDVVEKIVDTPKTILMLGAVNKYNTDSVVAFSKAIAKYGGVRLKILTRQTKEDLNNMGLDISCVDCQFIPKDQLKETILDADVLYLALGFDTEVQKEVEVVLPTRLMDYLPSGIPIIAHGPANTWTLKEAKRRSWAHWINTLDADELFESISTFLSKTNHEELISMAIKEAQRRDYHNMSKILSDTMYTAANKKTKK